MKKKKVPLVVFSVVVLFFGREGVPGTWCLVKKNEGAAGGVLGGGFFSPLGEGGRKNHYGEDGFWILETGVWGKRV